ncbi:unnamed protein product, partial [Laminaria digitata]
MIRTKLFIAASALTMAVVASPAMATTVETGTASSSTTAVVTQASVSNAVTNIFNGSGVTNSAPTGTSGSGFSVNSPNSTSDSFNFDREGLRVDQEGAAAGGADGKLAIWVQGSYSTFDQDQVLIAADGDTYALGAGADWQFSDRFIGGLSLSGYTSDAPLTFN